MSEKEYWEALKQVVITICLAVCFIAILGSLSYCRAQPTQLNPNDQAERVSITQQVSLCINKGGSWIPVSPKDSREAAQMSCVMPSAIPLVTRMNVEPE